MGGFSTHFGASSGGCERTRENVKAIMTRTACAPSTLRNGTQLAERTTFQIEKFPVQATFATGLRRSREIKIMPGRRSAPIHASPGYPRAARMRGAADRWWGNGVRGRRRPQGTLGTVPGAREKRKRFINNNGKDALTRTQELWGRALFTPMTPPDLGHCEERVCARHKEKGYISSVAFSPLLTASASNLSFCAASATAT